MYVFRGNPFQAHSLQQIYPLTQPFKQEKYKAEFIEYLTVIFKPDLL